MDMLQLHCYMVCERIKAPLAMSAMKSILYCWSYAYMPRNGLVDLANENSWVSMLLNQDRLLCI